MKSDPGDARSSGLCASRWSNVYRRRSAHLCLASADDDGEFSASGDGDGGGGYEDDEDDGDDGEDGDDDDYEHAGAEETKASDDEEDNTFG